MPNSRTTLLIHLKHEMIYKLSLLNITKVLYKLKYVLNEYLNYALRASIFINIYIGLICDNLGNKNYSAMNMKRV